MNLVMVSRNLVAFKNASNVIVEFFETNRLKKAKVFPINFYVAFKIAYK